MSCMALLYFWETCYSHSKINLEFWISCSMFYSWIRICFLLDHTLCITIFNLKKLSFCLIMFFYMPYFGETCSSHSKNSLIISLNILHYAPLLCLKLHLVVLRSIYHCFQLKEILLSHIALYAIFQRNM
jgi:hypothetical protein